MRRINRLSEKDLSRIVKRVIKENEELPSYNDLSHEEMTSGKHYDASSLYDNDAMKKIESSFEKNRIKSPRQMVYHALELAYNTDTDFNPTYLEHYLSQHLDFKLK